jgi:hypothetical protein
MSAAYTFLPWTRQGLGNQMSEPGPLRGSVPLQLEVAARQLDGTVVTLALPPRDVQLYGPGDVIGIEARAIIRTEPRDWITNFEPNYLAAIEFYDEDLPWRYTPTPAEAGGRRLSPWIMLVVLKETVEFDEGVARDRPLPFITVKNNARETAFPDPATLWAWAHVHVNRGLTATDAEIVSADRDAVAARLQAALAENADLAYSRIVCPRRLESNTSYCAFLLPSFESGRLAGLGLDPSQAPNAMASAWNGNGADADSFPVYFRWRFRTGTIGDFEYLVRLLEPKPVDKRVGIRDLDVQRPGMVPGITDPSHHGALPLGGALRVPRSSFTPEELAEVERRENWAQPYPHVFQRNLAALINLPDAYTAQDAPAANAATGLAAVAGDPDPVITPPLYGRWHAQTPRLLDEDGGTPVPNRENWVHQLNLDPVFRVPAGFGTRVVQSRQEELMAAAWDQVGDVLEANLRVRRFQFAQQAALVWYQADFQPLIARDPAKALIMTAPVHSRVMAASGDAGGTMKARLAASAIPPALVAATTRRLTRPRGRVMRTPTLDSRARHADLLARVNQGEILTAPPKTRPRGIVTVDDVAAGGLPRGAPGWLVQLLREAKWAVYIPLIFALLVAWLLGAAGGGVAVAGAIVGVGLALTVASIAVLRAVRNADTLREDGQTRESIDQMPASPDFLFTDPLPATATATLTREGNDSAESARFKTALKDLQAVFRASRAADTVGENGPERSPLDLARDSAIAVRALDPDLTIPRRAAASVKVPPRIRGELSDGLVEAKAYPVFDIPMYRPLAELSAELMIPNVNLIENNSITLLQTNQKFIEAYMVGLNHEFARELLWREYPTDQRGSCFRQFWDVSSFFAGPNADDAALREALRDVPPLHQWRRDSGLGTHDARERPGESRDELVLVIRGELLKRYPGAVIYAHAAQWAMTDGDIDPSRERSLVRLGPGEEDDPPRTKLRTPLYTATIEPDLHFLGFDLTIPEARGGDGTHNTDPPGWFFVIKERPGEPRFGFDENSATQVVVWNDLGWDRVPMAGQRISPVPGIFPAVQIPHASPPGEEEKEEQRLEDVNVRWADDVSAAELAYILYQAPVMVAIHAAEMLPRT